MAPGPETRATGHAEIEGDSTSSSRTETAGRTKAVGVEEVAVAVADSTTAATEDGVTVAAGAAVNAVEAAAESSSNSRNSRSIRRSRCSSSRPARCGGGSTPRATRDSSARSGNSYLAEAGDAYVPPHVVRQFMLRKADLVDATTGVDQRGRPTVIEVRTINDIDPALASKRPEFNSLTASYPERKLFMETGRPAKAGAELIRRAIDLIAPIGYGQRALIVAPARAGKTTLLHGITEGVAVNHPNAALLILLVDERPEEVSEAISWGVGEVIASSFDQPAQRHVEVTEMVLERAHRLVESGKDVVIVLDSLTRMARAHNTAERGTGRTLSGGLDATAMAKPKAFFGSARSIPDSSGGGSLTIIATALVETGSRMDDVIFEEFKGTGNCEIKLDRGLAEKRIYPAIDIGTSGTRREEKLFRPDQLDSVYTLRRGLEPDAAAVGDGVADQADRGDAEQRRAAGGAVDGWTARRLDSRTADGTAEGRQAV